MATKPTNAATIMQQNQYNKNLLHQQQLANQMAYAKLAQIDPGFAMGNLIGNAIFANINRRGVNEETNNLQDALNKYKGDNNYQAMNDILSNTSAISGPNANAGGDPNNSINVGLPRPDVPNPTGQPIAAAPVDQNAVTLNDLAQRGNIGQFDVDRFKAQYFEDAQKRGRPIEQVQQAWANMAPQIESMTKDATKAKVNTLVNAIGRSGENFALTNPEDLQNITELIKTDPTTSTILIQDMARRQKEKSANDRAMLNYQKQSELLDKRLESAEKLKNIQYGNQNAKMSDLTAAQKSVDNITKQITELRNMGQAVPDNLQTEYNKRMAMKEAIEKSLKY